MNPQTLVWSVASYNIFSNNGNSLAFYQNQALAVGTSGLAQSPIVILGFKSKDCSLGNNTVKV